MRIRHIDVQYFRCFAHRTVTFDSDIILIEGNNGSGKTSLLEALYYACYLRSFRTHSPRELVFFEHNTFFIKINFEQDDIFEPLKHTLQIGYSSHKRLVKLNDKAIDSYKQLMDYFRIIALTEHDLDLIKGGPEPRRYFMDQAITLYDAEHIMLLKEYKVALDNRNSLLQGRQIDHDIYRIWTEQLWHKSSAIRAKREQFLRILESEIAHIIKDYFPYELQILFSYKSKSTAASLEELLHDRSFFAQEYRFGRSLFGAHLDDAAITFQGSSSRHYASRGQQKLIMLLVKIAQLKALKEQKGNAILLLDDFLTDFDQKRTELALEALLGVKSQLIFTAPGTSALAELLPRYKGQKIDLSA